MKTRKASPRLVFFAVGTLATIWFLVRVIPKPSRAYYPCMQATAPFMSGFILYLISLGGAVAAFKRFRAAMAGSKYSIAMLFLLIAGLFLVLTNTSIPVLSRAGSRLSVKGYFTPNDPIGEAGGIIPGRVVWDWNPAATNENCTNTSNNNGVIDPDDDAWFMAKNNDQAVIDSMVKNAVTALAGATENSAAWDLIFRYFNTRHGKGDVGYAAGEKIFIKINATSAHGGLADGRFHADLSRTDNLSVNPFAAETNPYMVLSMIRQLVVYAQVPQNLIYVGDPARNIYKEFYDLWHGEFPQVNYFGNNLLHPELNVAGLGRLPVVVSASDKVFYSDHGTVMPDAVTDKLFTIFDEMDYLVNIPTMKAHATAGITLAAKNHFGSFTRTWAMQLHPGLMDGNDDPSRLGYGLYRVQTDIMMHHLLSGKNLLIAVDGLYPGEDALGVPFKWESIPFENDWCSSILMSLDPVAIESVCHDFLRTEYNGPTVAQSRPNWHGVDDYLHQAADSSLWPDNIVYDPDNDGILIPSLGVHEHWNDSLHKEYTRNLGTGNGIELFKVHDQGIAIGEGMDQPGLSVYPNPAQDFIYLSNQGNEPCRYSVINMEGQQALNGISEAQTAMKISLSRLKPGVHILQVENSRGSRSIRFIKY